MSRFGFRSSRKIIHFHIPPSFRATLPKPEAGLEGMEVLCHHSSVELEGRALDLLAASVDHPSPVRIPLGTLFFSRQNEMR